LQKILNMELLHPPSVRRSVAYKPASSRRLLLVGLVSVLYAVAGYFFFTTMGDPYRLAVEEFETLKAKHPEVWGPSSVAEKKAVKAAKRIGGKVSSRQSLFADFDEEEDEEDEEVDEDFIQDEEKEEDEEGGNFDPLDYEETPSMPATFLPNAWVAAVTFLLCTGHALFHLMCHWSVNFRAKVLFEPVTTAADFRVGCSVLMEPHPHRGSQALTPLLADPRERGKYYIIFQRQRYDYNPKLTINELEQPKLNGDHSKITYQFGGFTLMQCPDHLDVRKYFAGKGLNSSEVLLQQAHFGLNSLAIKKPNFVELFKQQLVSPIAMFQFFTSLLWLMDEYWQYCLFSIFNVVMFESFTVMQRLKTMKTLDGMTSKSMPIWVFRDNRWHQTMTSDLVPRDIVSICRNASAEPSSATTKQHVISDTIPCDCLILRGNAVVNEATLTGESVPQMKDAANPDYEATVCELDVDGIHRVHVLFSGTSLINSAPVKDNFRRGSGSNNRTNIEQTSGKIAEIPLPPNHGCTCVVLRTGFNSSQGELVQMIEFSTQKVSSSNKETFMALGLLLCFALVAAGYVLKKGLEKGDQTTHQLLLKCVIIVTSVVPQQLPMQMAIAVNTALMQLMKSGIFCTEPFRVPYAGKIQHCLFDKTGTLSTDKLIPIGVVNALGRAACKNVATNNDDQTVVKKLEQGPPLVAVRDASAAASMILAACHSLVQIDAPVSAPQSNGQKAIKDQKQTVELIGDPVELAALQGVSWQYNAKRQEARPAGLAKAKAKLAECERELEALNKKAPGANANAKVKYTFNSEKADITSRCNALKKILGQISKRNMNYPIASVRIQTRHHFASALQRMSVVCNVSANRKVARQTNDVIFEGQYVLVKGSPEKIGKLLHQDSRPEWYNTVYRQLAEDGMRVLALAYKSCQGVDAVEKSREWCESGLMFAGFISFACKTRSDSRMVVEALVESDHKVAMITGDAALTALHVARDTGIIERVGNKRPVLILEPVPESSSDSDKNGKEGETKKNI
jgi:cation-transporting ATPase 13A1